MLDYKKCGIEEKFFFYVLGKQEKPTSNILKAFPQKQHKDGQKEYYLYWNENYYSFQSHYSSVAKKVNNFLVVNLPLFVKKQCGGCSGFNWKNFAVLRKDYKTKCQNLKEFEGKSESKSEEKFYQFVIKKFLETQWLYKIVVDFSGGKNELPDLSSCPHTLLLSKTNKSITVEKTLKEHTKEKILGEHVDTPSLISIYNNSGIVISNSPEIDTNVALDESYFNKGYQQSLFECRKFYIDGIHQTLFEYLHRYGIKITEVLNECNRLCVEEIGPNPEGCYKNCINEINQITFECYQYYIGEINQITFECECHHLCIDVINQNFQSWRNLISQNLLKFRESCMYKIGQILDNFQQYHANVMNRILYENHQLFFKKIDQILNQCFFSCGIIIDDALNDIFTIIIKLQNTQ
ncbi:hypothetical protein QTN25_005007 [Entamoeba marina]